MNREIEVTLAPDDPASSWLIEYRPEARGDFRLLDEMIVERGDKSDWDLLHHLHYKSAGTPAGPRYWKLTVNDETVGVCVTSTVKGLLKERHVAFPKLKPSGADTKNTNTLRYQYLNSNFRVIARLVVDTMFRGIGAAYRFQNLVSRLEGSRFMEIQSSMSKYNLFAQKAGFRFVKPMNSAKFEVGLRFFAQHFDANPADHQAIVAEIENTSEPGRSLLIEQTRAFYYAHSALEKTGGNRDKGRGRVDQMPVPELIKQLQQMVLGSPMYGVYANPDHGRQMPASLPLTAFDTQKPQEKLDDRWF